MKFLRRFDSVPEYENWVQGESSATITQIASAMSVSSFQQLQSNSVAITEPITGNASFVTDHVLASGTYLYEQFNIIMDIEEFDSNYVSLGRGWGYFSMRSSQFTNVSGTTEYIIPNVLKPLLCSGDEYIENEDLGGYAKVYSSYICVSEVQDVN